MQDLILSFNLACNIEIVEIYALVQDVALRQDRNTITAQVVTVGMQNVILILQ